MDKIKLFDDIGWWLPEGEHHLPEWMRKVNDRKDGRLRYQGEKIDRALALAPDRRCVALDVGGHCGLWSYWLAKEFQLVIAFEPVALHRECFERNVVNLPNVELFPAALGNQTAKVSIHTDPTSSGDSWVEGPGDIPMVRLDDLKNLDDDARGMSIDLIKLDCEGYEYFALLGGEQTIKKHRPAIVVEQKPGKATKWGLPDTRAVEYLQTLGYRIQSVRSGDYFMAPA